MQKNYEQLKQYLHSEKAKPEKQILKSRELSMHTDENNIVTSYPNKDVQEERFVIRPNIEISGFPDIVTNTLSFLSCLMVKFQWKSMERPLKCLPEISVS